jgi:ABC-2 type transport system ATP-binding protein
MWEADKLCDRVAFKNQGKIEALDNPRNLKQKYGRRSLIAEISLNSGAIEKREIDMDAPDTAQAVEKLFKTEKVVTIHSEEATLKFSL